MQIHKNTSYFSNMEPRYLRLTINTGTGYEDAETIKPFHALKPTA